MAHGFRSCEATHRGSVSQQRQEFISDGRGSGHDNDLVHPGVQALADVGGSVRLTCLDLKGNAFALAFGHEVDGLAAAHGVFLSHLAALSPQVLGQTFLPVPVFWSAQPVCVRFMDAQCGLPKFRQRQYLDPRMSKSNRTGKDKTATYKQSLAPRAPTRRET